VLGKDAQDSLLYAPTFPCGAIWREMLSGKYHHISHISIFREAGSDEALFAT
jgi:hypothetical protein